MLDANLPDLASHQTAESRWLSRVNRTLAALFGLATLLVLTLLLPCASKAMPIWMGFVPAICMLLFITGSITSLLLALHARATGERLLLGLTGVFAFNAAMPIAYLAVFPGGLGPFGLEVGPNTAASEVKSIWFSGHALVMLGAIALGQGCAAQWSRRKTHVALCLAFLLPTLFAIAVASIIDTRPFMMDPQRQWPMALLKIGGLLHVVNAAWLAWRTRLAHPMQLWLVVSLLAWAAETLLFVESHHPFTVGWYGANLLQLAGSVSFLSAVIWQLHLDYRLFEHATRRLAVLASRDGLTELLNRRQFDQEIAREIARTQRKRAPLSLLILDIDYFKAFNDAFGHPAGDRCIQTVARAIERCARRPGDVAARYGGEEFAVILPDTPAAGALHIAEQIRQGVLAAQIPAGKSVANGWVSVSIGVATADDGSDRSVSALLAAADAALYQAKARGRNQAVLEGS
ncbi:diguanylate cyclase [Niveibacterium terrae]|uniref:GGDEF domain-containing protein n=1 Tax=Niveibacterium terrae TaxID=3373598 RepID=UPI003A926D4B